MATKKAGTRTLSKKNVTDKHAEGHVINIFDQDIVSSNRFSALTDSKSDITNKHAEDHVIAIPDQDTIFSTYKQQR